MHDPRTRSDTTHEHRQDAQGPARVFYDREGTRWKAYEMAFDAFDRRSGRSLIFASDGVMRRVRNYPANWIELSDEELIRLSWGL